jgi:MoaA/NifB/PqqE/SkfB family radical SAM enzyme
MLPERLNFAIARHCVVACRGCYSFFGRGEPELAPFARSAAAFARLGLSKMTLSGGDPLTLPDLPAWLEAFRGVGFQAIKLDTVGVGLFAPERPAAPTPGALLALVDELAIPLDGWSNASAALFRRGRSDLHDRTLDLLALLDAVAGAPKLIINTVVHRGNVAELHRLQPLLAPLNHVARWNLFQYTATDQASAAANADFGISDAVFQAARRDFFDRFGPVVLPRSNAATQFLSSADRLGHYLLVNSDGVAWLPTAGGLTHSLGPVFGREAEVLAHWARAVRGLGLPA